MKESSENYRRFLTLILLPVAVTMSLVLVHAQNNKPNKFLTASNNKYTFFIDLQERSGIVFILEEWMDKDFGGYKLTSSDTLKRQDINAPYLFVGKSTKIQNVGDKVQLIFTSGTSKSEKLKTDTAYIPGDVLFKINNAYWWSNVFQFADHINKKFPLYHYSFQNGLPIWEGLKIKETDYHVFQKFADQKIIAIRDSIEVEQKAHAKITDDIVANISSMTYETLKDQIQKLPIKYETEYFTAAVNAICMSRPELFFKLADELTQKKQQLFDAVDTNRIILKKLSDAPTNSPSKNEFFRIK